MDPIEILPAIPGHSHSFDANGRPTCGCTMPVMNLNPWKLQATNATPDFRRMADLLLARLLEAGQKGMIAEVNTVAEQLRQVWNARGAADLAVVNDVAHTNERAIERAIRSLDR